MEPVYIISVILPSMWKAPPPPPPPWACTLNINGCAIYSIIFSLRSSSITNHVSGLSNLNQSFFMSLFHTKWPIFMTLLKRVINQWHITSYTFWKSWKSWIIVKQKSIIKCMLFKSFQIGIYMDNGGDNHNFQINFVYFYDILLY